MPRAIEMLPKIYNIIVVSGSAYHTLLTIPETISARPTREYMHPYRRRLFKIS